MVFSLIKIIGFFLFVSILALGASELSNSSGFVRLSAFNFEFTMSPLVALLMFLFILIFFLILFKVLGFFNAVVSFVSGDETAVSRFFSKNRERKGFEALADGMVALASGEGRLAIAKAAKAEKLLKRPELTNLITAQAAEALKDKSKAYEFYKKLLKDDRTRFVGIIGIMKQKLSEGDTDLALKLAEKAFSLKPKHEKTQDFLLSLQADKEDWSGARKTLNAKLRYGNLPRDVHRRRDAVLALSEAKTILDAGKTIEAQEAAIEANKLSPDLIPAATMAAQSYFVKNKTKNALRVIKKAWEVRPHPDLASVFLEVTKDYESKDRIKNFKTLSTTQMKHEETKMFLTELYISNGDFNAAKLSLESIETDDVPNSRYLTNKAAVAKGQGEEDQVIRKLLDDALKAPRGPQWICDNCSQIHTNWMAVCKNCSSLDSLSWKDSLAEDSKVFPGVAIPSLANEERDIKELSTIEEEDGASDLTK